MVDVSKAALRMRMVRKPESEAESAPEQIYWSGHGSSGGGGHCRLRNILT